MEDGDMLGSTSEKKDGEIVKVNNNNNNSGSNNDGGEKNVGITVATASSMFPGFRFCPTDEELISYYLKKKVEGSDKCVEVISEVEIWKHEPWDLPAKSVVQSDNEWFFFSPRGRKYPNGSQSKRATESGYWKATGKERNVKSGSNMIGTKRTLVFHIGRAPKGQRTQWIMHEYCMTGNSYYQDSMVVCRLRKNNELPLNDTPGNQRNHLAATNVTTALFEAGQLDGLGLINGGECCSKEGSSSYSSRSVEQIESGSESDKLNKELPQHHSSSYWKVMFLPPFYIACLLTIVRLYIYLSCSDSRKMLPHLCRIRHALAFSGNPPPHMSKKKERRRKNNRLTLAHEVAGLAR